MSVEILFEVLDVPAADRSQRAGRSIGTAHKRRRSIHKAALLWIDDDPLDWARGADHLARHGYWVTRVPGSADAPQQVAATRPDVVILEVALQGCDGMSLLRAIRSANPELPIIIYSRTPRYRDDFTSWLADGYLVKSEDLAPLCDAVHDAIAAGKEGSGENHAFIDR